MNCVTSIVKKVIFALFLGFSFLLQGSGLVFQGVSEWVSEYETEPAEEKQEYVFRQFTRVVVKPAVAKIHLPKQFPNRVYLTTLPVVHLPLNRTILYGALLI